MQRPCDTAASTKCDSVIHTDAVSLISRADDALVSVYTI